MIVLLAIAAILAGLVWMGRRPARARRPVRVATALFSAAVAVGAVVVALRGEWLLSLGFVALSAFVGATARRPPDSTVKRSDTGVMSLAEARSILGVGEEADRGEILSAYRRLMQRAHPDHGGSSGLAVQLNLARARLIGDQPSR